MVTSEGPRSADLSRTFPQLSSEADLWLPYLSLPCFPGCSEISTPQGRRNMWQKELVLALPHSKSKRVKNANIFVKIFLLDNI